MPMLAVIISYGVPLVFMYFLLWGWLLLLQEE